MDKNTARMIRHIKRGCTYRRLAEIYYEQSDDLYGNQLAGTDLCYEAANVLQIDRGVRYPSGNERFDEENKSHFGDFYWWE